MMVPLTKFYCGKMLIILNILVNMVMFGNYFVNIVRNLSNLSITMVLRNLNENHTNIKVCFII